MVYVAKVVVDMSIELFVFAIVGLCGLCAGCGFLVARRLYKVDDKIIWESICTKCYTVRHSYQPLIDKCPKCGESQIAYHQVNIE